MISGCLVPGYEGATLIQEVAKRKVSLQSASTFWAQTQNVIDPTKAAASQRPPQLCSLPLLYPWK